MNQYQSLMDIIVKVDRSWSNHVREIALSEGVPDSYRTVLLILHRNPGIGQRAVSDRFGVTPSAINQVVKTMMADGYLLKEIDESDKRNSRLYLTGKGIRVAEKIRARLDADLEMIVKHIGPKNVSVVTRSLEQIFNFMQRND